MVWARQISFYLFWRPWTRSRIKKKQTVGRGLVLLSLRLHGTGIFAYTWLIFMVNVGKYTIHGSSGYTTCSWQFCDRELFGMVKCTPPKTRCPRKPRSLDHCSFFMDDFRRVMMNYLPKRHALLFSGNLSKLHVNFRPLGCLWKGILNNVILTLLRVCDLFGIGEWKRDPNSKAKSSDFQRSGIKFGHLESPGWGYIEIGILGTSPKNMSQFHKMGPYDGYKLQPP